MPSTPTAKHSCAYPGCPFSFTKRNHLERHWRTHTQAQDFSCPTCGRKFSRLDSRDRHIQRVHPEVDLQALKRRQERRRSVTWTHPVSDRSNDDDDDEEEEREGEEGGEVTMDAVDVSHAGEATLTDHSILDQDSLDQESISQIWQPHYGAAEQLSRLRHQPFITTSSTPISNEHHPVLFEASHNVHMDASSSSTGMASDPSVLFTSINATSPSTTSLIENQESFLDIDPMMCSLLWRTLEASITEASGSSYLTSSTNRLAEDQNSIFDLLTSQSRHSISIPGMAYEEENMDVHRDTGERTTRRRGAMPSNDPSRTAPPSYAIDTHEGTSSSSAALGPEAAQMAAQMKSDLHAMMGHIEAPVEPEKGLAASCFWLCRRHFLPTSVLTAPQKSSKVLDDGYALVMNLIAIGSLWHHSDVGRKWGADIWSFTLRVVWSRGMRNVQDDSTVSMLMSILLSGHSYVLMSSDPAVHRLGRRAWLFCHLLHDHCNSTTRRIGREGSENGPEPDDDLEVHLNQAKYRAELRKNLSLLQHTWQRWRELEGRIRVAWGICMYDSQQSAWLDMKPSLQADVSRQYPEPASERLFEAKTAQEWLNRYEVDTPKRRDLDSIMKLLHRPFPCSSERIVWSSSQQASYNILESIFSSWLLDKATLGKTSEYWNRAAETLPPDLGLLRSSHALANWRLFWGTGLKERKEEDNYCLLIRWHCIHMTMATNDVDLVDYVRDQTRHLSPDPHDASEVLQIPKKTSRVMVEEFYSSARGRRALWHAGRISAELSRLPRVTSTPLHVAQAAYESTLLLVAFALIAKGRQDARQQAKAFELLGGHQSNEEDAEQWTQLGLAGFLNSDSLENYRADSAPRDWASSGSSSSSSSARRWIEEGETRDAFISGLSIQQCSMALQDLSRALAEGRLIWCLAADYQRLINRSLTLLA